jgi:hypothetical protein
VTTPTPTSSGSFTGSDWTGVAQTVSAVLQPDGSPAKTPSEKTKISVAGSQPVTLQVPVADSSVKVKHAGHFKNKTPTPKIDNETARVDLAPGGIADEELSSHFKHPLPISVAVSFQLNGKTVANSEIRKHFHGLKGKSGTVQVSYKLTNTTSQLVHACFQGFNGQPQNIAVSTPAPIYADLSLTVPQGVKSFSAPGSTLTSASKGVTVGWTAWMFQPLGDLTKTFTLTMNTSSASIPRATLLLLTLNPESITGQVPASSAAALGTAEAAVNKGIASVQGALDSLQQHMSGFQSSRSQKAPGGGLGKVSLPATSHRGVSLPKITLPAITLPQISLPSLNLPSLSLPALNLPSISVPSISPPTITTPTITAPTVSLPSLPSPNLETAQTDVTALVNHLDPKDIDTELAALGRYLITAAGDARKVSAVADAVKEVGTTFDSAVTDVSSAVDNLVSEPVKAALLLVAKQHDTVTADLNDLAQLPAVQNSPEVGNAVATLESDLNKAWSDITDAFLSLETNAGTLHDDLKTLKDQIDALEAKADTLETTAAEGAARTVLLQPAESGVVTRAEARIKSASNDLQALLAQLDTEAAKASGNAKAQVATAQAAVDGELASVKTNANQAVANAQTQASQAVAGAKANLSEAAANASQAAAGAKANLSQAAANASQSVAAATAKLNRDVSTAKASASQAVATATQQAGQAIQSSQQAAQTQAAQISSQVQNAIATANTDYATLLAINEQAILNEMPAGTAKGATAQNGTFIYIIQGS